MNQTHPSSLTSGKLRLRAIRSLAMRLNWLILKSSFILSCSSLGMRTAFPISPGPSWFREITAGRQESKRRLLPRGRQFCSSPTGFHRSWCSTRNVRKLIMHDFPCAPLSGLSLRASEFISSYFLRWLKTPDLAACSFWLQSRQ